MAWRSPPDNSSSSSQVSESLPKTSYFKMVDIWLIFCIGITFLVIIYHALVDSLLNPGSTPVSHVWQVTPILSKTFKTKMNSDGRIMKMVLFTKITVPLVFFIFNIGYWGYIFAN
ncbi:uncharacterized protein [Procambarus clarkii]|uniref:uncharacterized protein n=1 Tax=Procambarus clarkii TaxID=6728 RepID=UPI0037439639